jgi:chromate transporter
VTAPPVIVLAWHDWLDLFVHYLAISMMSVGGTIATTAEMHRYLVEQHGWLSQTQFNDAIAIAQAAPGPNVLFVALMGWNVGLNAGSYTLAALGALVTLTGAMLPSSILMLLTANWCHRNRGLRAVRAFKQGMAPLVIAMLVATGIILGSANGNPATDWPLYAVSVVSALLIWRTRIHLLWLLGAGALLGAMGLL